MELSEINQPHSVDDEQGTIGCCILERSMLQAVIEMGLVQESFHVEAHRVIWKTLVELFERGEGQPIDSLILLQELERLGEDQQAGGWAGIEQIMSRVNSWLQAKYFARRVLNLWSQRQLMRGCFEAIEATSEGTCDLSEVTGRLEGVVRKMNDQSLRESGFVEVADVVDNLKTQIEDRIQNPEKRRARVITPLKDLNQVLPMGGFLPGQLIVLAARPSVGKTALAVDIASRVAVDDGVPVLFFTLEMSREDLVTRAACSRTRIDSKVVEELGLYPKKKEAFYRALDEIESAPIFFNKENSFVVSTICAKSRQVANKLHSEGNPLGLIIVDYLQIVESSKTASIREQAISEMTRSLKLLAGELEVPILALSQLNRQGVADGKKPGLSALRESGAIEQDADIVLMLHRPEQSQYSEGAYPDPNVEVLNLIHAKVRNGPVGELNVTFRRNYTRFEDYTPPRQGADGKQF